MDQVVIEADLTAEMACISPVVEIDGQPVGFMQCLSVEDSTGIIPGKAVLRLGANSYYGKGAEIAAPSTLNRYVWKDPKKNGMGSRVRVYINSGDGEGAQETIHLGTLLDRNDSGSSDNIVWTSYDDSILLNLIPLRGAFVYDGGNAKLLRRYTPRVNPGGQWNCVGVSYNGGVYPIFTNISYLGKTYESPDDAYVSDLQPGEIAAWTPRRFLKYLWFCLNINPAYGKGVIPEEWRGIFASKRLAWDEKTIDAMVGYDPASEQSVGLVDPLDRKMPDIDFQGQTALIALDRTLKTAGTHDFGFKAIAGDGENEYKSTIVFYPLAYSAFVGADSATVPLQRGGTCTNPHTVYDFSLNESIRNTAQAILVEGDVVRLETSVAYAGNATDPLQPAWTSAEETAFLACVFGDTTPGQRGQYALYAQTQDDTTLGSLLTADGLSGRPVARAASKEAVELARQSFPRVFRAFFLQSDQISGFSGVANEFSDTDKYPVFSGRRPMLPEQLQFFLGSINRGDNQSNWLHSYYPIRVELKGLDDTWRDAGYAAGLRIDPNGTIYLDQFAEAADSQPECLYDGNLYDSRPGTLPDPAVNPVALKDIRLNIAVPMDHRVTGYKAVDSGSMTDSFRTDLGGPPLKYFDMPGAFHESHQVGSTPGLQTKYYLGTSTQTAPLTRYVPPGSEQNHAQYAAERKLWGYQYPHRNSTWKIIGIRPEYHAGMFIDHVEIRDGNAADKNYDLKSIVATVLYDFENQETVLGGLIAYEGL